MSALSSLRATATPHRSRLRRQAPMFVVYGLLALLFIIGALYAERFLTSRNLINVLRQAAFLGTVALGQTLVILAGGIDLSVGSLVKVTVLVTAIVMDGRAEMTGLAMITGLALGAGVGLLHGLLVTRLHVAPFIATLGTYSILRGIALAIANKPVGQASPAMLAFYDIRIGNIPVMIIGFALLLLLLWWLLRRTIFGRYLYAIGGSEPAARLSGLPVDRVVIGTYMLCSTLAAVTGLLYLSRMGLGDPNVADGLELQAITAVILGARVWPAGVARSGAHWAVCSSWG
ncbi:MAG: ABC transporter permease [Caldilineaceae bacterium]